MVTDLRNIALCCNISILQRLQRTLQRDQLVQNSLLNQRFLCVGQLVIGLAGSLYLCGEYLHIGGFRVKSGSLRQRTDQIRNIFCRSDVLLGRLLGVLSILGVFLDYTFTLVAVWKGAAFSFFARLCLVLTVFLFRRGDRLGHTFALVSVFKGAAFGFGARLCLALTVFALGRRINRGNLALTLVTFGQSAAFGYAARLGYFRSFCLIRIAWFFYYNCLLIIKDRL